MISWCIDADQIVHSTICRDVIEPSLPYKTKPASAEEMRAWLLRPDIKEGHGGPPMIAPCLLCVGA